MTLWRVVLAPTIIAQMTLNILMGLYTSEKETAKALLEMNVLQKKQ